MRMKKQFGKQLEDTIELAMLLFQASNSSRRL